MDASTASYYDRNAPSLAGRYEMADMNYTHQNLLRHLPEGGKVLELGCGSGRDATFLLNHGFDVTAVDGSYEMLSAAIACHPELTGRTHHASIPLSDEDPLLDRLFNAIVMIATIMHISDQDLFACACQLRQQLSPNGIIFISTSLGREGIVEGRDSDGRIYVERQADELQLLFERIGFRLITNYQNEDSFGRNFNWITLVMQLVGSGTTRSIDEIETIIRRDRKDATYKLALLRALCEIAQMEHYRARWLPDGRVSVPLGLVVEKWLIYYWSLVEADGAGDKAVIPQKRGMEINKPIAFRKVMRDLISFYNPHGGLSSFYQDYKSGSLPYGAVRLLDVTINTIAQTIVAGPVKYTGGALESEGSYFGFQGRRTATGECTNPAQTCDKLGHILVSAAAWREMCLIGHWLAESLILRWAELTFEISKETLPVKDVIDRLLIRPTTDRDVQFARSIYAGLPNLECVWTHAPLDKRFAVDHTVPFSICYNNDLWNLLPSALDVNVRKRDKLVTRQTLFRSKDSIIHYWGILKAKAEQRFSVEVSRALLRDGFNQVNWETPTFSGLVEKVEMLAIQRGIERWEP